MESYRGIFILSIIRTIKDKLIHNDIKDTVFDSMSDSQVGATKGRSIRNHIFIVNSVINEVKEKRNHSIDLLVYDVRKCFDELDLSECVNDLYETGIKDDKLNLIYESNKNNNMAINVPSVGLSERTQIKNKITQGGPLGPSMCAVHIDKIGKQMLKRDEYCYEYKNISIPALSMIDDVLAIAKCGCRSVETNSYINSQFEMKNLNLNKDKCHQIHIGKPNDNCPTLKAHNSEIKKVNQDKYLGDVISSNANNDENIRSKISNGMGAISNILNIIREVSLGEFYFQIALLLRQTVFLSTILLNSEAWVNLTQKNIEELEKN